MGITYKSTGDNQSYFSRIAEGKVPNHSLIYKFGRNPSVGSTETLIAEGGVYGLPTIAQTVEVTSNDVTDVYPSGTGARTIEIFGLDSDFNEISEIVEMDGVSINSYLRVYRAKVRTAGTITPINGGNKGVVTVAQTISGIEMVKIQQRKGQTLVSCYTIPSGYKALMWSANTTTGEGKNALSTLLSRDNKLTDSPFQTKGIRDNFENTVGFDYKIPIVYDEKTDIVFTTVSSSAGTSVSGSFLLELIKI